LMRFCSWFIVRIYKSKVLKCPYAVLKLGHCAKTKCNASENRSRILTSEPKIA
jgi:hypothetical protein